MSRISQLLSRARSASKTREAGQIIVLFAAFVIILMLLAGSAYDYASIVVDDSRLQNAVDAAALAGADSLSSNAALPGQTPVSIAQTVTTQYLSANHIDSTNATIGITVLPYAPPAGTPTPVIPIYDSISIDVKRAHPTTFWPVVGIPTVTLDGSGQAKAARGMVDVMLSLDLTGSENTSGSIPSSASTSGSYPIQDAVAGFVRQMRLQASDPRGSRVGIARFAGLDTCTYNTTHDPDYYNCSNDSDILMPLSTDSKSLIRIADRYDPDAASTCPAGAATTYACGLYWHSATPGGTRLPNSISVLGLSETSPYATTATYAWSTANGGRNDSPPGTGNAHKVLVLMTDGKNEDKTVTSSPKDTTGGVWDTLVQNLATRLEKGEDGVANTPDDVEIYVVNYACTPYNEANGCYSRLADTDVGNPSHHPCPAAVAPSAGSMSATDSLLIGVSSSSSGSCDHYFPLRKTESLPQLFSQLAGTISRGQLTR
jgi:Flp pilus assembly protein TadG